MKKPIKIILIVLAVLVGLFAALLIWLTATQLNVKTETAVVTRGDNSTAAFAPGDEVSILSWNVGYAGVGDEGDALPISRPMPTALRRQAACAPRRSWTVHTP